MGGGVVHVVGGMGARLEHRHTFVAGCQRLPPDLQPNVASAGGNRPIHPNHGSGVAPKGLGGGLAPRHPTWGHVGVRLGHPSQLRSGCQRSVAEFGRYMVCAGGNRPIHPNRGSRSPPREAGGDSPPPESTWGNVGARLGHLLQLRSGCQRSVAEFGRYVVCAGGSRPIHPNRGTGLPPKGLGRDPTPKIRPNRRHRARGGRGSAARWRPSRATTLSATFPFQRVTGLKSWSPGLSRTPLGPLLGGGQNRKKCPSSFRFRKNCLVPANNCGWQD